MATTNYPFRVTYKQDADTYIEDRGYPHIVKRGDENFSVVNKQFGKLLEAGQTARMDSTGEWEVSDGCPMLDDKKSQLLQTLDALWKKAEAHSYVDSSLGYTIDANERANRDINGLITALEETDEEQLMFCDANNEFHPVTLENLKVMRLELIQRGQEIYATKWQFRSQINSAEKLSDLDNVQAGMIEQFQNFILNKTTTE